MAKKRRLTESSVRLWLITLTVVVVIGLLTAVAA